ncbi:hypothetical protein QTH87_17075 [Variovorax sp. J22P168]|uniref:hypothetical protein n=1 Tax=Variovorax jilinensis TaxID=3053513 RepID=UPI0025776C86|nr:hypothetical protein [Variovorax sp. J22P168]MDM0014153.1 hypothetical protein [Variovorax sp. J22P168]
MKTLIAILFASSLGLLAGCASGGANSANGSSAGTGGSGVTVFGTIDAGVTNTRNQSR